MKCHGRTEDSFVFAMPGSRSGHLSILIIALEFQTDEILLVSG